MSAASILLAIEFVLCLVPFVFCGIVAWVLTQPWRARRRASSLWVVYCEEAKSLAVVEFVQKKRAAQVCDCSAWVSVTRCSRSCEARLSNNEQAALLTK